MTGIRSVDAVLVIDMQNSFLHPEGAMYSITGTPIINIDATVAANRQLIDTAREAGVPVIFTRHGFRPGYTDAGQMFRSVLDGGLIAGTWDTAVVDELAAGGSDLYIDKNRMDAFYNTDLEVVLRGLSARRLAIAGVVTNACVETTTRSAAMRDYHVTVLSDCCSTVSEADQQATMAVLSRYGFAHVTSLANFFGATRDG